MPSQAVVVEVVVAMAEIETGSFGAAGTHAGAATPHRAFTNLAP